MKAQMRLLFATTALIAGVGHAQYNGQYSPAIMNEIGKAGAAAAERNNAANAAAQAEANRQWWAEENRIRAKIKNLKESQWYGAIAVDVGTSHAMGGGGYPTKELAIQRALDRCTTSNCKVVAVFSNTCAMLARPDSDEGNPRAYSIVTDKESISAIMKAMGSCESRYGKGNCNFIGNGKEAICSGYEYGVYNQK